VSTTFLFTAGSAGSASGDSAAAQQLFSILRMPFTRYMRLTLIWL